MTGTAVTPHAKARMRLIPPEGALCTRCTTQQPAHLAHILWTCPATHPERVAALHNLALAERPAHLHEWTHPKGPPDKRKRVLEALLQYLRTSGTAHLI